jgi:hypothetical protein
MNTDHRETKRAKGVFRLGLSSVARHHIHMPHGVLLLTTVGRTVDSNDKIGAQENTPLFVQMSTLLLRKQVRRLRVLKIRLCGVIEPAAA